MNNELNNKQNNPIVPSKKEFNPLWFLIVMGVLIGVILIFEVLGLKK